MTYEGNNENRKHVDIGDYEVFFQNVPPMYLYKIKGIIYAF